MKTTPLETELLRSLRPLEIATYLRLHGWQEQSRTPDRAATWTQGGDGDNGFEILLPLRQDFHDYVTRMAEILHVLEVAETRPQSEIISDFNTSSADVIRIRTLTDASSSGSVPIEESVLLFQRARDVILAAACAAVSPRPAFQTKKPQRAVEYLKSVRMGQTERGSYVMTIISPVVPALAVTGDTGFPQDTDVPFERRVVTSLLTSLEATRDAAETAAATGAIEPFRDAIKRGVSANLCEAVADLAETGGTQGVEFSCTWSQSRPAPIGTVGKLFIPRDAVPFVREAARVFRETAVSEDVEVIGVIQRLERPEGADHGKVVIVGLADEQPRRVEVSLSGTLYGQAIQAHQDRLAVVCFGDLIKEGTRYVLRNPRDFRIDN